MVENQQNSLFGKIAAYTEILKADPLSTIFVSLSESYRKLGMHDEALSIVQKGLASLPDYGPGHVVLARIKCQQGDLKASEASFQKALDIDPDNLAALVGFSRLYLLQDNKVKARNLLLTARELSPADSVINKLLLSLPGPEVEPEIEKVDSQDDGAPDVNTCAQIEPLETATLAELYLKQGMTDKALNIFRKLHARDPDNLDFRRRMRDIDLLLNGISVSPAEPPCSGSVAETIATDTDDYQNVNSVDPLKSVASTSTHSISSVVGMSVLDRLDGLLISIQKRREDV